jgi:hypothetical protein
MKERPQGRRTGEMSDKDKFNLWLSRLLASDNCRGFEVQKNAVTVYSSCKEYPWFYEDIRAMGAGEYRISAQNSIGKTMEFCLLTITESAPASDGEIVAEWPNASSPAKTPQPPEPEQGGLGFIGDVPPAPKTHITIRSREELAVWLDCARFNGATWFDISWKTRRGEIDEFRKDRNLGVDWFRAWSQQRKMFVWAYRGSSRASEIAHVVVDTSFPEDECRRPCDAEIREGVRTRIDETEEEIARLQAKREKLRIDLIEASHQESGVAKLKPFRFVRGPQIYCQGDDD